MERRVQKEKGRLRQYRAYRWQEKQDEAMPHWSTRFALPECQDRLLAQRCYPRAGQMQHPALLSLQHIYLSV